MTSTHRTSDEENLLGLALAKVSELNDSLKKESLDHAKVLSATQLELSEIKRVCKDLKAELYKRRNPRPIPSKSDKINNILSDLIQKRSTNVRLADINDKLVLDNRSYICEIDRLKSVIKQKDAILRKFIKVPVQVEKCPYLPKIRSPQMKKFVISASNNENRAHTRRTTISLLKKENEDLKSHIPIFVDMWTFRLKFLIQAEIYAIKKSKGQIVEHGNETLVDLKDIDNQINEVSSPLEKIQILLDNEHLFYLIKMIDPNMKPFPRKK